MDIDKLKQHNRPHKVPRTSPLFIKKLCPVYKGLDFRHDDKLIYRVTRRVSTTDWESESGTGVKLVLSEEKIVDLRAEVRARQILAEHAVFNVKSFRF